MVDDLSGRRIGERIRIVRDRRGMTRDVVAGRLGKSADWLKKIESGTRAEPRLSVIFELADVLGVDPGALIGASTEMMLTPTRRESHPVVPAIRDAIEETALALTPDDEPDLALLRSLLDRAWRAWHTSPTPRAAAGRLLPQIIRDARRAARVLDGAPRREANAVLVGAYILAEQVLAWVCDPALLRLSADRAMGAAEAADRPDALAGAAWVVGNVWRATGREEEALQLADEAAALLAPRLENGTQEERALWGAARLHAAITAARLGREGDALHRLDAARTAAGHLGAYVHPWTLFSDANSNLTAVSVHVELRQGGTAIDKAGAVDPDSIPSVDRRARLWLECARAYERDRDWPSTLHHMQRAVATSEESMRAHPLARSIAAGLVASAPPLIASDARALAAQVGVEH